MKTNINKVVVLFAAGILLSGGCTETVSPPSTSSRYDNEFISKNLSFDTDFKINYGETVSIPGENLSIKFNDVLEDSRCPEGVECIWQGTAKIELLLTKGTEHGRDTIQTYLPQDVISLGEINNSYRLWLKNVEPYPKYNQPIGKKDYVITLNISHFTYGFPDSLINGRTGTYGQVFISPVAPIERLGYINYKPFQTSFKITGFNSDTTVIQTDSTGRFIKYLSAGEYHVVPQNKFPLLSEPKKFTVTEGKMTFLEINFDSGIR